MKYLLLYLIVAAAVLLFLFVAFGVLGSVFTGFGFQWPLARIG